MNYLYNGIELPELPEWDKEKYPYAFLYSDPTGMYLGFCCVESLSFFDDDGTWRAGGNGKVYLTEYANGQITKLWEERSDESIGVAVWAILWSNTDIIAKDGSVQLTATEPVPVGNRVRWYRYNDIELPRLPEWDKDNYPYAFIQRTDDSHRLVLLSDVIYGETPIRKEYAIVTNIGDHWYAYDPYSPGYYSYQWAYQYPYSYNQPIKVSEIVWANFNVLNEDGSVFLPASDPVPVPDEPESVLAWQKHDAYKPNTKWDGNTFYRVMGGKWVKQDAYCAPIAYRYNDVELPDINEVWTDKVTYPCAMITRTITDGTCLLHVCGDMPYYTEQAHSTEGYEPTVIAPKPCKAFAHVDGSWVLNIEEADYGAALRTGSFELIWTNVDVMNKDNGAVYFSASEPPVPVYA